MEQRTLWSNNRLLSACPSRPPSQWLCSLVIRFHPCHRPQRLLFRHHRRLIVAVLDQITKVLDLRPLVEVGGADERYYSKILKSDIECMKDIPCTHFSRGMDEEC